MKINNTHISLITTWLRHKPFNAGFKLDSKGWVGIEELLNSLKVHGIEATLSDLDKLNNDMPIHRWQIDYLNKRIKATHGHSVPINIDLPQAKPSNILYHSSRIQLVRSILKYGILPMWRQFVSLTSDMNNAIEYSKQRGSSIIWGVNSEQMYLDDFVFYNPQKTIWITRFVPLDYLLCNSWAITRDIEKVNEIFQVIPVENSIYIYSNDMKKVIIYNNFDHSINNHTMISIDTNGKLTNKEVCFEDFLKILTL